MSLTLDSTFYENVESALQTRLLTVAGIPPAEHLVLENQSPAYVPQAGTPWLRWTFRPQPNRLANINADAQLVRHIGAVMIDYYVPRGEGTRRANTVSAAIVTALRPGTRLIYNGLLVLVRTCFAQGGQNIDQHYQRPITLGWTADTIST